VRTQGADSPPEVDLLAALAELWRGGRRRVAVLGSYGMGKSYLAWRSVLDQAEGLDPLRDRVPILYPLKDFHFAAAEQQETRRRDLLDQVLAHALALDFPRMDRGEFIRWIERGRVGIVLDGLDELTIPRDASWQRVIEPLASIPGAHLALTSRTAYVADPDRDLAGWEVFDLLEWQEREWRRYVEGSAEHLGPVGGPERLLGLVAARDQLAQLTRRPLWCYMILSIAEEIPGLEDLALSGLYQRFLDRALQRKALAGIVLSVAWRYCAMERFAEACLRDGRSGMNERQLADLLDGLFETVGERELRQYLTREARTYSFLNCDRYRYYSFGHSSFEAYFAATGVVRWLAGQVGYASGPVEHVPRDPLAAAMALTADQASFAAGVLQDERAVRSLRILPDDVSHAQLHTALVLHLQEKLAAARVPPLLRRNLLVVYLLLLGRAGRRLRLKGLRLDEFDLTGIDLSGCDLEDVDLSGARLRGARFVNSTLAGCRFFGATLDGADFTDADLEGADLTGIERPQVPPLLARARHLDRARLGPREREFLPGTGEG
jgi:hypothetical protein